MMKPADFLYRLSEEDGYEKSAAQWQLIYRKCMHHLNNGEKLTKELSSPLARSIVYVENIDDLTATFEFLVRYALENITDMELSQNAGSIGCAMLELLGSKIKESCKEKWYKVFAVIDIHCSIAPEFARLYRKIKNRNW